MKIKNIFNISLFFLGSLVTLSTVNASPVDYSSSKNPFAKNYIYEGNLPKPKNTTQNQEANNQVTNPTIRQNRSLSSTSSNSNSALTSKYRHLKDNSASLNGCWDKAGAAYGVDPWLLFAIAKVESSFNPNATNRNKDKRKSLDMGMMQINSFWLPTLSKFGITKEHLFDPCTSVFVGAWIVAQNIKQFGYNQDGIGAYNSPRNVKIRRNYAKKVYAAYYELLNDFGVQVSK